MNIKTKYDIGEMLMCVYDRDNEKICGGLGKVCGINLFNDGEQERITYFLDSAEDAYGRFHKMAEEDLISIQNYSHKDIIELLISMGYKSYDGGKIFKQEQPSEYERYNEIYLYGYSYLGIKGRPSRNLKTYKMDFPQLKDYI